MQVRHHDALRVGGATGELEDGQRARVLGRALVAAGRAASSSSSTIGGSPGCGSRNSLSCAPITTTCAPAWTMSRRVWATKSSIDASRIGRGSTTTVAPASHVAWIAVTNGRVVAPSNATWLPGPTPRPAGPRHAARALVEA